MTIKIEKLWKSSADQRVEGENGEIWVVSDLIEHARDLPVMDIPLRHLSIDAKVIDNVLIKLFARHMKMVLESDLKYPIILDENGSIFDGRHRVVKALLEDAKTIKAVRFEKDPPPTFIKNE